MVGGFIVGFVVWGIGAGPGVQGSFEGERDVSLFYVELPLMFFGMPALALGVWALTLGVLRVREWTAALAVVVALAAGAWGCTEWLEVRTAPFTRQAAEQEGW